MPHFSRLLSLTLSLASLLLLPAASPGQEPAHRERSNPLKNEDAQRGMAQFQQTCAMCHGSAAKGTGSGPNLIQSSVVRHDEQGNLITPVIQQGRADHGMPAFPNLTAGQISDIVAFLHAMLVVTDSRSATGPAAGYSLQRLLTGNATAGKAYFQKNCTSCHAASGDLAGVAKKYAPAELESHMLYPRVNHQTGTVFLPSGKSVKGQILHADTFDVAIVDAQGNYHSWPLGKGTRLAIDDPLRSHFELLKTYSDKEIHDLFAYLETLQ